MRCLAAFSKSYERPFFALFALLLVSQIFYWSMAPAAAEEAEHTQVIFQDDFEGYASGTYPNSPSGSGAAWQGPFIGGGNYDLEVSSTEANNGTKSLLMDKIDTPGPANYIRAIASFNQSTQNIIFID